MTFAIKKLPDSQIELTVNLDKTDLYDYVRQVENKLVSQSKIAGFRAGKAPRQLIRKQIGEDKIKQESLTLALQSSLAKVLEENEFSVSVPPNPNNLKILTNTPEELVYSVSLNVFPEVKLGPYLNLRIKQQPVVVAEGEVDSALSDLSKMRTVNHPVERPAKLGDWVEVDFVVRLDGKIIENGQSENHPLTLGENKFIPGFEEALVGLDVGQEKAFSLTVPPDYYQKSIAGKDIAVNVKLKKVAEKIVPELNDDFARGLGKFNSLVELKTSIHQGLLNEKKAKEKERIRRAILQNIASQSVIIVPGVLVEKKLDALVADFDAELHRQNMELGLYLAKLNKTQDDLRKDWREKAASEVKLSLIAREIAGEEKLAVSQEEVANEFAVLTDHLARQGRIDQLQEMDSEVIMTKIKDSLLNEKVLQFLEQENAVA